MSKSGVKWQWLDFIDSCLASAPALANRFLGALARIAHYSIIVVVIIVIAVVLPYVVTTYLTYDTYYYYSHYLTYCSLLALEYYPLVILIHTN